jgi:hypothetical protein
MQPPFGAFGWSSRPGAAPTHRRRRLAQSIDRVTPSLVWGLTLAGIVGPVTVTALQPGTRERPVDAGVAGLAPPDVQHWAPASSGDISKCAATHLRTLLIRPNVGSGAIALKKYGVAGGSFG